MGCDIHCYTEYRDKEGKWQPADAWVRDDKYGNGQQSWRVPYHLRPYTDRNYNLFAWLADVRNGTWGEQIPVLAAPKGLPEDVSERIAECSRDWDSDGHSHSWFTRKELNDGWDRIHEERVRFEACPLPPPTPEWIAMPTTERPAPSSYCASSSGPNGDAKRYVWYQPLAELIKAGYHHINDYLIRVGD